MKHNYILNHLKDIQLSIDYLSETETESLLYSLSFSQAFINACSEIPSLDDFLMESLNAPKDVIKCNIESMINLLG